MPRSVPIESIHQIVVDYVIAIGADSFSDAMHWLRCDEGVGSKYVRD